MHVRVRACVRMCVCVCERACVLRCVASTAEGVGCVAPLGDTQPFYHRNELVLF